MSELEEETSTWCWAKMSRHDFWSSMMEPEASSSTSVLGGEILVTCFAVIFFRVLQTVVGSVVALMLEHTERHDSLVAEMISW